MDTPAQLSDVVEIILIGESDGEVEVTGEGVIDVVEVQTIVGGEQGPPGTGLNPEYLASGDISGHRVVKVLTDNKITYASSDVVSDAYLVRGITTGAATNSIVILAINGSAVTEPSWTWVPGSPIYLVLNGNLTQTPPTSGFLLQVAVATAATSIVVSIQEPTLL